jgi:hypothetical protein
MSSAESKTRGKRIGFSIALIAGVLSPLGVFPITSSCVPLASILFCVSLTCMILFAIFWSPSYRAGSWTDPWAAGSPRYKPWIRVQQFIYALSVATFLVSLCFFRRWHHGQINWQMTISSPGYMFLVWGGAISSYIRARTAPKQAANKAYFDDLQPIRSQHWGQN